MKQNELVMNKGRKNEQQRAKITNDNENKDGYNNNVSKLTDALNMVINRVITFE